MKFVTSTRPGGSGVAINPERVLTFAPVKLDQDGQPPNTFGTRVFFGGKDSQDVTEPFDKVVAAFAAAT